MHALNFFRRQHPLLTVEERDLLDDWELVLCEVSTPEAVAFLPCLQRCFARVQRFMTECRDELKAQNKKDLVNILQSKDMESRPMSSFCAVFLTRYLHRLSEEQLAVVAQWERELCVSETELVEKFLEMLGRREADLKVLGASSVEQLFSGHSKKTDEDLRFGYDFVRRQWSQLALADQERIRKALEPLIHPATMSLGRGSLERQTMQNLATEVFSDVSSPGQWGQPTQPPLQSMVFRHFAEVRSLGADEFCHNQDLDTQSRRTLGCHELAAQHSRL